MDRTFEHFLENTASDAAELQRTSDLVVLDPLPPSPPSRYLCRFSVAYLRRTPAGTVAIDPGPVNCCIRFPGDYLRCVDSRLFIRVASVLTPVLHPNIFEGIVCLGAGFAPGTPIRAVVWQLFQILTYRNCTVDERNALNGEACRLLRMYPELLQRLDRPRLFKRSRREGAE